MPLLRSIADFDKLDGKMQAKISVRSTGTSQRAIMSNMAGTAFVVFQDGAISGLNVAQMIRSLTSSTLSGWQESEEKATDLSQLSASFKIDKGQAQTTDLNLVGPLVKMTGAGTIDLGTKQIGFRVEPKLVMTTEGQGRATDPVGLGIPVMIEGPWAAAADLSGDAGHPRQSRRRLCQAEGDGQGPVRPERRRARRLRSAACSAAHSKARPADRVRRGGQAGANGQPASPLGGQLGETIGNLLQQGLERRLGAEPGQAVATSGTAPGRPAQHPHAGIASPGTGGPGARSPGRARRPRAAERDDGAAGQSADERRAAAAVQPLSRSSGSARPQRRRALQPGMTTQSAQTRANHAGGDPPAPSIRARQALMPAAPEEGQRRAQPMRPREPRRTRVRMNEVKDKVWFLREGLFAKYVVALVGLVVFVLAVNGAMETWITYRGIKSSLSDGMSREGGGDRQADRAIDVRPRAADQLGDPRLLRPRTEQRRADYAQLLRQVPQVSQLSLLNGQGREQLRMTRQTVTLGSDADFSRDVRFTETVTRGTSFAPAYFRGPSGRSCRSRCRMPTAASPSPRSTSTSCRTFSIDAQVGKVAFAYVIDPRGDVLATSSNGPEVGKNLSALPQVAAVMQARRRGAGVGHRYPTATRC